MHLATLPTVSIHLPLVPHIDVSELGQHWFRQWLVTWSAPSHYLNQCWNIVNWTLRNKLQWNSNQNTKIFIDENPFENVVWEMTSFLSRVRWVKIYTLWTYQVQLWGNMEKDWYLRMHCRSRLPLQLRISYFEPSHGVHSARKKKDE